MPEAQAAVAPEEGGPFSPRAQAFLQRVAAARQGKSAVQIIERVEELVADHDAWRRRCLNLNPAESGLSLRAQRVLASDMATRLSEGVPGDKAYPHGVQNDRIDELEGLIITLAREQFGAAFVEWRPVSTTMANAAVFFALLEPGDPILVQSEDGGGNFSYHAAGPAGLARARIIAAPFVGEAFDLDLDAMRMLAEQHRPKMIVIGGSNVLFPYPVRELRALADSVGAVLMYDAAHLGLLVADGGFQRPLDEGAHVVTVSTHKIMGGPVGGMILTQEPAIARRLVGLTFPGLMQTRDQNKFAALAIALAETGAFGGELAGRMVANARALAAALAARGFDVIAQDRGYTATHQLFLRLGDTARRIEERCQAANILLADCALAGEISLGRRTGARLATHEITRLGLGEAEMDQVAELIARAAWGDPSDAVARDVAALLARYPTQRYSFDQQGAHG